MASPNCDVIIPAAGSGVRYGSSLPKQFLHLRGRPILAHTLERFLTHSRVNTVIVCLADEQRERVAALLSENGWSSVRLVKGGATRQQSVVRGLAALDHSGASLVAVHDAVRPFFSRGLFDRLLAAAEEEGGAIPVMPVTDTIHRTNGRVIVETPARESLAAAQTPQCFRRSELEQALQLAVVEGGELTDEAAAATRAGFRVRVIEGERHNIKITTPEDLALAERQYELWSKACSE